MQHGRTLGKDMIYNVRIGQSATSLLRTRSLTVADISHGCALDVEALARVGVLDQGQWPCLLRDLRELELLDSFNVALWVP